MRGAIHQPGSTRASLLEQDRKQREEREYLRHGIESVADKSRLKPVNYAFGMLDDVQKCPLGKISHTVTSCLGEAGAL